MIEVRSATAVAQKVKQLEFRDSGGAHPVKIAQVRNAAGVAKTFWQEMSAIAEPAWVTGAANVNAVVTVATSSTTAIPTGGTAPYSYAWTGGGTGWTITNPTSATTAFTRSGLGPSFDDSATFSCTVTDATGLTVATNTVNAFAQNVSTV